VTLILPAVRAVVASRARNRCEYCQLEQDSQVATFPVDHVVPRDRGGLTNPSNLALSCTQCNALKWIYVDGTDMESGLVVPLFNPRTDQWNDRFR
jgi:5-methylcytosine-specific restriction endonuclease McrA